MKRLAISIILFLNIINLYSQSSYTSDQQNLLQRLLTIWPYIGVEPVRPTTNYIPYDYIHESYKRDNLDKRLFSSILLYELSTLEIHMNSIIGVNLDSGRFSMPNMYLSIGKSFHYDWFFSATPFITLSSKFDVKIENNKLKTYSDIDVYDAGIETVTLTRILLSFRLKSVNDINETTFMLLPSVVDISSSESFLDTPHWYIPRINNNIGFRAGFIGYYYELSYSQGFSEDSSPLALVFKLNGDYFRTSFLYQYNQKDNISISDNNTHNLVQLSAFGKIPFFDHKLWINMLGEYTWRENDAHYLRLELALEWNIFNIGVRPLFYIPINELNKNKELFALEYSTYLKFNFGEDNLDSIYFGFQGSTDGRYYIAFKTLF